MKIRGKKERLLLFFGDLIILYFSLYLTLAVRYRQLPNIMEFREHLAPFSILFIFWILVFFIAGLYEKHTLILRSRLPQIVLNAQITNVSIAVVFFYFISYFEITPKTNLFIYIIVSSVFILIWRNYGYRVVSSSKKQNAVLVGFGEEIKELAEEVNNNLHYNLRFISSVDIDNLEGIDFDEELIKRIYSDDVSVVVIDLKDDKVEPLLPHLYNLIFSKVRFVDMHKIYEDIFDRIPLSLLRYNWFLENISMSPSPVFDFLKRSIDVLLSSVLTILSIPFYIAAYILIKLDDGGPVFIVQERIGQNNRPIKIIKFRSMSRNDQGEYDSELAQNNKITRVGKYLRKSRIDEIPQLLNVIEGKLSLVGPRPELPALVKKYEKEIPYYNVRHLIKPGLSGWAQIYHDNHPHHKEEVMATKEKLSYDLFYIKNKSFLIDLKIALRTLKTLVSRSGI